VEILEGTLNVIGSTISGNTASGVSNSAGGGIWNDLSLNNNSGIVNSRNSIIAGNAAAADLDISGSINSKGHNLIGNSTGATITGDTASNVLNQDTNLASLANNGGTTQTKRVLPASPAIDAGADFTTLTSAVDASTTSINVADATGFPAAVNYFIKIDDERMKVTARNGNTATVARGATPAAHASGAGVNPAFDQRGQTRKAGSSLDIGSFETNYTLSLGAGNSQSATVGSAFGTAFHFTVIENGHPLAGVSVTFTAPPGGASGTFAGASNSVTVTTDANGIATSPVFTANTKVGSYSVAVGFGGNGTTFFYDLTNNPGPLNHVSVTAPTAATSGAAFNATVSAVDEFDNVITTYKGTVHFTSTDTQANLPADSTLSNGTATFSAVLRTTGNQTISATDKLSSSITGTSAAVSVGTTVTFLNISTRMEVLTDDNVLIAGFIIRGQPNTTKKIMIRGLGPSLAAQAVPNPLPDPLLELHGPSGFATITNDNWQEAGNTSEIPNGFQPSDSHESVIVAQLPIGANGLSKFTAIVRGAHGESGVGLVEAYDLQPAANQFANISTRGFIDTGDNVMIGGIILGGGTNGALTKVLVRAIGPSLSAQGVNGALQDPTLELRNKSGDLVAKNDNWRETQEQAIKDTTVPPTDDRESAIVATLPGGNYTAIVRGKSDGTGIGLIELFNLQ